MNAGNTSPSIAQHPGKTVSWHLDAHPGDGLQPSGARGSSKDRRSMGGGGGGHGVGCFLCNCSRLDWRQPQTTHLLSPLRVSNPNAGKGCRQKKGAAEDETVGQHR